MITTLSSKGHVVLPRSVRSLLHLVSGIRLECSVEGNSIILTLKHLKKAPPKLITDEQTGLIVYESEPGAGTVTNEAVRNLLSDFP